jgi:ankyrin repeat protein
VHVTLMQDGSAQPCSITPRHNLRNNVTLFSLFTSRALFIISLAIVPHICVLSFDMRLLQFDEHGEPSLVEFVSTNLPRYAVLSHTWGEDAQEVTYQDIENGKGRQKYGWHKLQFCRDRAKHDGLQYSWIDTCCINKSSSAELSEAINSMFSWYHRAEICYVYLSDVSNNNPVGAENGFVGSWKRALEKSSWFTRGWTLQELIAPSSVQFFSREGIYLGSRDTLEQIIHEITEVSVEALRRAPLSQFTKEERLSWAAKRKTKRGEDAAYCLLGIFDVFIPPIYGEGREHAFARLEEAIDKVLKGIETKKKKLMMSLRFEQIEARYSTIKREHAQTCGWLLSTSEYRDWLDAARIPEHHGFLWIKGKPGTGKSTLMKFALANARRTMSDTTVVAFFFHARGEEMEKSTLGTYRSLLLQLLESLPKLQSSFDSLRIPDEKASIDYHWDEESLQLVFEQAVRRLGKSPVICFIDALDECEEQQVRNMITFFEQLGKLSIEIGARLQVCFSSRHYPNITVERGLSLVVEGQAGHSQDIINYVKDKLRIGESRIARQIREDLLAKASGVFMWAVIVVDILRKEYDRGRMHAMKKRLAEIPDSLHELFYDILTRDSRNTDELVQCCQWVLYAKELLRPEQLYYAILAGVEPDAIEVWDSEELTKECIDRFILDASKGLTQSTSSESSKVQFIHESVRDFFYKENGLSIIWPALKINFEGQSHDRLKQSCLNYLNWAFESLSSDSDIGNVWKRSLNESVSNSNSIPLMSYVVQNTLYHADKAEGARISQRDFIQCFPWKQWTTLHNILETTNKYASTTSNLYILAEQNMSNLVRTHPSAKSCFNLSKEHYGAPFLAAIANRSIDAANAFIDVLYEGDDKKNYMHVRSRWSVHRFKYTGKDIVSHLTTIGNQAIFEVALRAYEANINTCEYSRSTHFLLAAANGHLGTVQGLLETRTVNVNARADDGSTALSLAVENGHGDTVKLLLRTPGIDMNVKNNRGVSLLVIAVAREDKATIEMLLETGEIDVNARDEKGSTSLLLVTESANEEILKLLLDTGKVQINEKGGPFRATALSRATKRRHHGIVKLLLSNSEVDVNVKDNTGNTPLLQAVGYGDTDIVKLLLSNDEIDRDRKNYAGKTALLRANELGHQEIVELLLNASSINVRGKNTDGDICTPCHGQSSTMELSLRRRTHK